MMAAANLRLRRLRLWLVVAYLAATGMAAGYVVIEVQRQKGDAMAVATARLEGLARALEEHVVRAIGQADDLMVSIIEDFDPAVPLEAMPEEQLYTLFNARIQRAPQIVSLGAFDTAGRPLAHSRLREARSRPAPRGETFDYLRAHPEEPMALGRVVASPITGQYVFPLSRRVPTADGAVGGFLTAAFNPTYFSDFYEQLQMPAGGSVVVLHDRYRRVLVRYPATEHTYDLDASGIQVFSTYVGQRHGSYVTTSFVDGIQRLVSFRRVEPVPVDVVISLPLSEVLAPAKAVEGQLAAGAAAMALVLAALLAQVYRAARLDARMAATLRQANQDLEERVAERTAALRKLSRAVEQSPHMIFVTDLDGTIEYVNPKFTELTGYTAAEAIGHTPRLLKSGNTPMTTYWNLWTTIKAGGEWRAELEDRRKDGTVFWAAVAISPVRDEEGRITHFVSLHEDITARKAAEEQVRAAKEQAEIANRAKSDLLASMSHELRTPLNAVIGYSEALLLEIFGPPANERQREYLTDIHASGLYLLELISDLLDLSAVEAGKLELHDEVFDLPELARASLRLLERKADVQGVALSANLPDDLPPLKADRRRIKQILLNLLSNAVKFSDKGGTVRLTVRRQPGGDVAIEVADDGIGMDAHDIESAVKLFGRARDPLARNREGTGLGLPLTNSLARLHGGRLVITSVKGVGTVVTVVLPGDRLDG